MSALQVYSATTFTEEEATDPVIVRTNLEASWDAFWEHVGDRRLVEPPTLTWSVVPEAFRPSTRAIIVGQVER